MLLFIQKSNTKYVGDTQFANHWHKPGVGNLRPAKTFGLARIRIFVTQVRVYYCVKTKLHDKQVGCLELRKFYAILNCSGIKNPTKNMIPMPSSPD